MRRLVVFLAIPAVLFVGAAVFDWWIDPSGLVWKPAALAEARQKNCLVSEELIGSRYWSFKRDVFFHRPTRSFVVGSSRVLKMASRPGETSFSNLGYPGTSPETILRLFRSLPAKPVQTVYVGVEAFWFNRHYALPTTDLSWNKELEYLLARKTFTTSVRISRESSDLPWHRWRTETVGGHCVLDRFLPTLSWRTDGSRVWAWELDPQHFPTLPPYRYTGNLETWRNGYYRDWTRLDEGRVEALSEALDLAKARGWDVVGFAPPEPPHMLHVLDTDPRLREWREFLARIPQLFRERGFAWANTANGAQIGCRPNDFPDAFHSDARCSRAIRYALRSAR